MEERGGQREDSGPPLLIGYLGTFHGFVLFFLEGMEGWRIGLDWIQHVLRVLCHSSFVFVFFGGGEAGEGRIVGSQFHEPGKGSRKWRW